MQLQSSILAKNDVLLTQRRQLRSRCVRPRAVATPDVRADDTAEARRQLARQFRRHKLEPQLVGPADVTIQGLQPRPQLLEQFTDPQLQVLAAGQTLNQPDVQWPEAAADAPTAAVAASAARRQLLERLLDPHHFPASSTSASSSQALQGTEQQLPLSLLLDGVAGSTAGKEFTKAIKRVGHWRQVQSLVQEHGPELNAIHLCACMTRLVHLQDTFSSTSAAAAPAPKHHHQQQQEQDSSSVDPQVAAFVQQLMDSIGAIQQSLEHRQACNVLWAVAKLRCVVWPSQQWLVSMYQHALSTNTSSSAAGQEAAQLAYSLVSLSPLLPEQQVQDIASGLLESTQALLQEQLYAQHKQPAGEQQHQEQQQQQEQQRQVAQQMQQMSARDLATLAWSLATLGLQPSTAWLSAYASVISSSSRCIAPSAAGPCHHRDLSMLLWATATFSKTAAKGSAAANSLHAAAGALLQACQSQDSSALKVWDGQSVSNTLWALATLGQRPSVVWLNKLLQHLERSAVKAMTPQAVSVTLWALAALGVVPRASCMSVLLAAAAQHMAAFTPQAASNTIWALAVLEHTPPKPWIAGFWQRSRVLLPAMTGQGLINCLWAVARLGVQPPQEWVVDAAGLLLDQGVEQLGSQGLSNVLWAMARISNRGRQGQELLDLGLHQAVQLLELQLQQQQQQQQELAAEAAAGLAAVSTQPAALFNIYELSGLMHTVSLLTGQQQQPGAAALAGTGSSSSRSSSPVRGSSSDHSGRSRSPSPTRLARREPAAGAAAAAGDSASSSSSSLDEVGAERADEPADLLHHLAGLLQSASLPLLPSAGAAELSILLWSQVTMPASAASQNQGQTSAQPTSLLIPRPWMDGWLAASKGCFGAASSRDLAQWLWCLAKRGVRPSGQWLASFQVASYRQMGSAGSQDLSNMLWALASLGTAPDPAWLQQHLREVSRRQAQRQLLPQHLANLGWALAKLGHRPDRGWLAKYQEDVFTALPELKPQEMSNVLWALAVLNCKAERALLSECQVYMAAHMQSFKANEVAVSLWAMSRLRGQPDMRLMGAALQHCFSQARQLTPKGLSMLMWSVGNMEVPPPKAWVAKLLVATQVRMPGFSAQELSMLAVSLARLEYRPSDAWLDCFAAAAAAQMNNFEAQALANTLWALATLHYTPHEDWMAAFDAQLQRHLSSCTPAHIAMTMWAISRLQWLPQQPLWQQLQERAELHSASFCLRSQRMLSRAIRVLEKVEAEDDAP